MSATSFSQLALLRSGVCSACRLAPQTMPEPPPQDDPCFNRTLVSSGLQVNAGDAQPHGLMASASGGSRRPDLRLAGSASATVWR